MCDVIARAAKTAAQAEVSVAAAQAPEQWADPAVDTDRGSPADLHGLMLPCRRGSGAKPLQSKAEQRAQAEQASRRANAAAAAEARMAALKLASQSQQLWCCTSACSLHAQDCCCLVREGCRHSSLLMHATRLLRAAVPDMQKRLQVKRRQQRAAERQTGRHDMLLAASALLAAGCVAWAAARQRH